MDIQEAIARENTRENRRSREAAKCFIRACEDGDVQQFCNAVNYLNDTYTNGWRLAMLWAGRLPGVSPDIRDAFLNYVWIPHKHLPLKVGTRRIMADALRGLLAASDVDMDL